MIKLSSLWAQRRFAFFIFLMFAFRSAIADWNDVPTGSMKPTVKEGDRVILNKMAYGLRLPFTDVVAIETGLPQRGDIVAFDSAAAEKRLLKRIIGLPGDRVELIDNRLTINGQALAYRTNDQGHLMESILGYEHALQIDAKRNALSSFQPVIVPQGNYLVLGDNRSHSADSRVYGFVPRHELRGKATHVAFSLDYDDHFLPRPDRFAKKLDEQ